MKNCRGILCIDMVCIATSRFILQITHKFTQASNIYKKSNGVTDNALFGKPENYKYSQETLRMRRIINYLNA